MMPLMCRHGAIQMVQKCAHAGITKVTTVMAVGVLCALMAATVPAFPTQQKRGKRPDAH